jgi:hypothetical protein
MFPQDTHIFLHTDPQEEGYQHVGHRAAIALKRVGDSIMWGVSICGAGDNFEKKVGRDLALDRLVNGFGRTPD